MFRRAFAPFLTVFAAAAAAEITPPSYVCQRTTESIVIDGKGDEAVWKRAAKLSPLRDIEGPAVENGTEIRMLWDDENLYILAEMPTHDLWATVTERDTTIFQDPDFEVFIDPTGEGNNYIELEINQLNTVWDLFIARTYRHDAPIVLHDWNMPGLRHAVSLSGTLNHPGDRDKGWSVELAIPWRSITTHNVMPRQDAPPQPGSSMRFNFSCVDWLTEPDASAACGYRKKTDENGNRLPELNHVWAPTGKIDIHMPERWGMVTFSPHPAGTWEAAPVDEEAPLRLSLYDYYTKQRLYAKRHSRFAVTAEQHAEAGLKMNPEIQTMGTEDFFVVSGLCPSTGRRLQMDSNGQFRAFAVTLPRPQVYLWVHGGEDTDDTELWRSRFRAYAAAGVDTVVIGDTAEQIRALTPTAREAGLKVIAWLWALNRPQDKATAEHPDWFAVSREGKSCFAEADRPYVPYYQFLCPNHPGVRQHLLKQVELLAAIPGISGIQLDYMRLPDVILPRGLWEKYGLIMDRELPPYDFCYCENCRRLFREQYGRNLLTDAEQDANWREFRLQSVARLATDLCHAIRAHGKTAACAVFPTPQIAAQLVRQDWQRFPLDLALPMVYHSFYNEPQQWVAKTAQAAADQTQQRIPLAPGLHLPDFTPASFRQELERLRSLGVKGIGIFSSETFTPAFQAELQAWRNRTR